MAFRCCLSAIIVSRTSTPSPLCALCALCASTATASRDFPARCETWATHPATNRAARRATSSTRLPGSLEISSPRHLAVPPRLSLAGWLVCCMSRRHAGVTGRTTVTHPSTNRARRRATSSMRLPGSLEISSPRHLAVPPLYKRRRVAEADIQMPRDVCFHLFCFFSSGVCVFVELFLR